MLTGEELGAGVDGDEAAAQHVVRPHPGRPVPHLHSGATCVLVLEKVPSEGS